MCLINNLRKCPIEFFNFIPSTEYVIDDQYGGFLFDKIDRLMRYSFNHLVTITISGN